MFNIRKIRKMEEKKQSIGFTDWLHFLVEFPSLSYLSCFHYIFMFTLYFLDQNNFILCYMVMIIFIHMSLVFKNLVIL